MIPSIISSLGYGSGIDVPRLISDLASASRDPKVARFDAQAKSVQASISAVGLARSDIGGFATSLATLLSNGSLQTQPSVSDATVLDARTTAGTQLGDLSADIEIIALARSQTTVSANFANASDPVGEGTMTISVGGVDHAVIIDSTNNSLTGLAKAINDARTGVKATIVNDGSTARLLLKSATGLASAFSLSTDATTGLAGFAYPGSMQLVQAAQDASFKIDGLSFTRSSNIVTDAIPGVTLTLKKALAGQSVGLSALRSPDTLRTTLSDFVSVYNELKGHVNDAVSATRSDQSLRSFGYKLAQLIAMPLTSSRPSSLSEIGLSTNRDGTIILDAAVFTKAFAANPQGVEALFVPTRDAAHTADTDPGIGGALMALQASANNAGGLLDSLTKRLTNEAGRIATNRTQMEAREEAYRQRLTKSYGNIDARLSALKATQSYLDQQIKLWTADR